MQVRSDGESRHRVLVLDKDPLQLELTAVLLRRDRYEPVTTAEPEKALMLLEAEDMNLALIEPSMTRHDGYRVCQQIRQLKPQMPLMVVSEQTDEEYIVRCILAFADDYLTKPFSPRQLLARVHAQLRRAGVARLNRGADGSIVVGDIRLNLHQMQVNIGGAHVQLTPREISLLSSLMMNPNRVLSRDQLIRLAWGDDFDGCYKTVDVCVQRLRRKLEPHVRSGDYIQAVRGFGYKLRRPERTAEPAAYGRVAATA